MQFGPRRPWTALATAAHVALLAVVFAGCAPLRTPAPDAGAVRPALGETLRVAVPLPREAERLRRELAAAGFSADGPRKMTAGRAAGGGTPYVDAIDVVAAAAEAPLLLSLGEVDVALSFGADADRAAALAGVAEFRAPGWDRTYYLWLARRGRTLGSARARAGIVGALDRGALVRYTLAGRGTSATTLFGDDGAPAGATGAVPSDAELTLRYDATDRVAVAIAARLHASLGLAGVVVRLDGGRAPSATALPGADEIRLRAVAGLDGAAAVLADVLEPLAGDPDAARGLARLAAGPRLDEAARLAEFELRVARRLVPLVRAEAWVAARPERVAGGPTAGPALGLASVWVPR